MEAKIIKIGSSKGIVLNHTLLQEIGAKEGDKLNVSLSGGVISLKKERSAHDEFEAFFQKNGPMTDSAALSDLDIPASTLNEWTW
jgi:antitoxin component of MazEF toxin-antitoxin module